MGKGRRKELEGIISVMQRLMKVLFDWNFFLSKANQLSSLKLLLFHWVELVFVIFLASSDKAI